MLTGTTLDPDDIILGPPRTSFSSSTSTSNNKLGGSEKASKDSELRDRAERFNFRNRSNESDALNDRFRDGRTNNYRRRGDGDQDGDSRAMAKPPRKSFGNEGAERFHGRIGSGDRFSNRDDRRAKDRDDRDNGDRRSRNFDPHSQDKEGDDAEATRRNGMTRGRSDPWFKESSEGGAPTSQRERIDRTKNWRERDPNERQGDKHGDRTNNRGFDRRWDREQRVEREPEWLDEPADEKPQGHTEEDFKKFMEAMKATRGGGAQKPEAKAPATIEKPAPDSATAPEQKVVSAPAVGSGPDKFFAAYGSTALDGAAPVVDAKEAPKPKGAKPSRFTSFFSATEDTRGRTEPPTPVAGPPPPNGMNEPQQQNAEKEAFQVLLQKLQRQTLAQSHQPGGGLQAPPNFAEHPAASAAQHQKGEVVSPEPFQPYGMDRREDPRLRMAQHPIQDMLSPRSMPPPAQPPAAPRPEQNLQDLLAQRHHAPSQGSGRMEQNSAAVNSNTEFLMRLMQSARNAPEPPRTEQLLVRMPQPTKQVNLPAISDRDAEFQRDRSASQRQMRQHQGPPVFLDEQFHNPDGDNRPQPTQILQRPPPPGLDHHMHPFPMAGGGQQMPPQRPMIPPPPGLINNSRNMPMPGMFPPNFPPGAFPPPDAMVPPLAPGPGPRSMQPPPGFYGGPPPPGFMPPPGMGQFQGPPEGLAFGAPFDGRGMPPPGGGHPFRRP